MRRTASALAAVTVAAFGTFAVVSTATAGTDDRVYIESECLTDWYVNPDEGGSDSNQGDRRPTQTEEGLLFEPADLVHHAADLPLTELGSGGTFAADPAPDENFRFSVEIINKTPIDGKSGYATLHWDGAAWFIGGADSSMGQYEGHETDAANFIGKTGRFGEIGPDSTVISFGVGYTKTPPGTVTTTVSSVTFAGKTYDLSCKPQPPTSETTAPPTTETTSAPANGTTTATETTTPTETTSSTEATDPATTTTTKAGSLPVTGASLGGLIAVAVALIGGGIALLVLRRRRANTEA